MKNNNEQLYSASSNIPASEFSLAHNESNIHDTKFETRPIGWLEDSARRFAKNRASVVGAIIILCIALFAIIAPIASPKNHVSKGDFPDGYQDKNFSSVLPKLFNDANGFWDGTEVKTLGEVDFKLKSYNDANDPFFDATKAKVKRDEITPNNYLYSYTVRVDSYAIGTKEVTLKTKKEMDALVSYEQEKGISYSEANAKKSIIKPLLDVANYVNVELPQWLEANGCFSYSTIVDNMKNFYNQNQYIYYKLVPTKRGTTFQDAQFQPLILDGATAPEDIYKRDANNNLVLYEANSNGEYKIRVDYYDYFVYRYGFQPTYIFGANQYGQDIFLRLALGARFSLLLGLGISIINFIIGLVYGAISGYYGGKADLIMERVTDIIANVPTIIIMTIAQIQLTNNTSLKAAIGAGGTIVLAILVAFVYNGWVGVAGTTRMQFYRFKGQEYVLASRTLGAKDRRLIFKHILPNAAGTLVTSCVLMIPSVIFSESSLSYLGIINFQTSGICSVGALLNEGQAAGIGDYPHILLFPAIVISLLMVSFNLFGNGLRDAFNTTLRGSED